MPQAAARSASATSVCCRKNTGPRGVDVGLDQRVDVVDGVGRAARPGWRARAGVRRPSARRRWSATVSGVSRVNTTSSTSIAGSWSLSPMQGVVNRPNVARRVDAAQGGPGLAAPARRAPRGTRASWPSPCRRGRSGGGRRAARGRSGRTTRSRGRRGAWCPAPRPVLRSSSSGSQPSVPLEVPEHVQEARAVRGVPREDLAEQQRSSRPLRPPPRAADRRPS